MLNEMSTKAAQELTKMTKFQELVLVENKSVNEQLAEIRGELLSKVAECDSKEVLLATQKQEIETLKLSVTEL